MLLFFADSPLLPFLDPVEPAVGFSLAFEFVFRTAEKLADLDESAIVGLVGDADE